MEILIRNESAGNSGGPMSTRRTSGKSNKNEIEWTTIIVLVVIFAIIQILGDYCNRHAEERRQKSWERFEARNAEIMHMVNWNNAVYH